MSRIGGSPRILGSTSPKPEVLGNSSYGPLFSDRDSNPRLNDGNCFRVEHFVRTSSNIKLDTGGSGRIPRVWFHFWQTFNSSENFVMGRFSDLRDSCLYRTAVVAFANDDGEFQRKFDLPRWRIIAADFETVAYDWGIPIRRFPPREIPLKSSVRIPTRKAYLPMYGNAWQNSEPLPLYQIFIWGPIRF